MLLVMTIGVDVNQQQLQLHQLVGGHSSMPMSTGEKEQGA
jgi:hypothetical protein